MACSVSTPLWRGQSACSSVRRPGGRASLARCRPRAPQLLARARQNGVDGWESWDDAPDTPRLNGTPAAAAADGDWRGDVQSLAASLRVGQVRGNCELGSLIIQVEVLAVTVSHPLPAAPAQLLLCRGAPPPLVPTPHVQSSFGSSDGSDWDSYYDEEKERCFLVGVQVGAALAFLCLAACAAAVRLLPHACLSWFPAAQTMTLAACPWCSPCLSSLQLKQQRSKHGYGVQESLEELGRLADTAGLEVVGSTYQLLDDVSRIRSQCDGM